MESGGQERRSVSRQLDRLGWRLDALDDWRKDLDSRVSVLESKIVSEQQARVLMEATRDNKIADAVAKKLSEERGHAPVATAWPLWQKAGVFVGALVVFVDSFRGLLH